MCRTTVLISGRSPSFKASITEKESLSHPHPPPVPPDKQCAFSSFRRHTHSRSLFCPSPAYRRSHRTARAVLISYRYRGNVGRPITVYRVYHNRIIIVPRAGGRALFFVERRSGRFLPFDRGR